MKLGFVSSILENYSFEEVIDFAASKNFECVELACWPKGKADRRYAGVSHIDVDSLDSEKIRYVKNYCNEKNVDISALAYYPNTMDGNLDKRKVYIDHLKKVIVAAKLLDINLVTTFIGRVVDKNVDENLEIYKEVWTPLVKFAEENNVRIAIENCPMLFSNDEWPGGQNLAVSPAIWRNMFQLIPSKNLGINFDPSHFIWQQMDYIKPIYEFKDRIYHVHYKDVKIYRDKLDDVGILAPPLQYMSPKLPGLGDVNWAKYVSALTDIGYNGYTCIEVEDKAFEDSNDSIEKSLILSKKYLKQYVI